MAYDPEAAERARAAIQRILDGHPPNGTAPETCGPWAETVGSLYQRHAEGGTPAVRRAFDVLARTNQGLALLMAGRAPEEPAAKATPKSEAIVKALTDLGYTFRLNQCSDTVELNGCPINDIDRATIFTAMRDLDFKNRAAIEDTWTAESAKNGYHPIRSYLERCEATWDGQPYITRLCQHLTCSDAPVSYTTGSVVPLANVYLYRWLIGCVAKIFNQARNLMLVFAGPQGIGKSEFAAWLCHSIPRMFIEGPIAVGERDTDIRLMNHFVWEVSELDATTRRADVAALKALITRQTVTARKAYGHYDTVKPACANLFGTVNNGAGFLADETGNRRFYVTTIDKIDWGYTKLDIDQVWGEAVALWRKGTPWQLVPSEQAAQTETNRQHEVDGLLDDWIPRYFTIAEEDDYGMTAAEIVDHLRTKYDIRLSGSDRAQAMEIARVMTKLGIPKRQRGGKGAREYRGLAPRPG